MWGVYFLCYHNVSILFFRVEECPSSNYSTIIYEPASIAGRNYQPNEVRQFCSHGDKYIHSNALNIIHGRRAMSVNSFEPLYQQRELIDLLVSCDGRQLRSLILKVWSALCCEIYKRRVICWDEISDHQMGYILDPSQTSLLLTRIYRSNKKTWKGTAMDASL